MRKIINSASDIPEWFSLNNYEFTSSLDAAGWYKQFSARQEWHHILEKYDINDATYQKEYRKGAEKLMSQIISHFGNLPEKVVYKSYLSGAETYSVESLTVLSASYLHWEMNRLNISDDLLEREETEDITNEEYEILNTPFAVALDRAGIINPYEMTPIYVDLYVSDEQLKSDFEEWLEKFRKISGLYSDPKKYSKAKFQRWHKLKILPYLDLSYWANIQNTTITQSVYGAILFPDERDKDTTYKIRSSVIPTARKAIDGTALHVLGGQANIAE